MLDRTSDLPGIAEKLAIGWIDRHVFYCVGGECSSMEEAEAGWEALKKELKDRKLSLSKEPGACYRTKAGCLRVCKQGPIVLVYPEGIWYSNMTADRIPRLVQQHLIEGNPIEEWIFARNPLPRGSSSSAAVD
jgi:(2Fe-2S) ferredoxin